MGVLRDPLGAHAFRLELDGADVVDVLRVEGLGARAEVYRFEEGGVAGSAHVRLGRLAWDDLELAWPAGTCRVLRDWRDAFLRDPLDPELGRGGSIALLDGRGDVARRWSWTLAWPVRWRGPALDAGRSQLAVEVLTLAHEGLREGGR